MDAAALIADCTSCAAASMSRLRSNCSVTWLMPNELDEVMVCSAGICPNWRSSGAVTRRSDGVGIGAGQLRGDLDGRKINLRQRRNRQPPVAEKTAQHHRDAEQRRGDRSLNKWATIRSLRCGRRRRVTASLSLLFPAHRAVARAAVGRWCRVCAVLTATLLPSVRRTKPVVTTRSVRLEAAFDNGLGFILLLYRNRPNRPLCCRP